MLLFVIDLYVGCLIWLAIVIDSCVGGSIGCIDNIILVSELLLSWHNLWCYYYSCYCCNYIVNAVFMFVP